MAHSVEIKDHRVEVKSS